MVDYIIILFKSIAKKAVLGQCHLVKDFEVNFLAFTPYPTLPPIGEGLDVLSFGYLLNWVRGI